MDDLGKPDDRTLDLPILACRAASVSVSVLSRKGSWVTGSLRRGLTSNINDTAGLWGAENLPGGAFAIWGGSFYAIPEQSENKELAWDLIKFMTTREDVQLLAFDTIEAFPALKSTWKAEVFEQPIAFLDNQQARQLYINVVNNIAGTVTHPGDVIAAEVVTNALSSVLNDGVEIDAALAEAEQIIKRRAR